MCEEDTGMSCQAEVSLRDVSVSGIFVGIMTDFYDSQDREIWYLNVVKLGKEEIQHINDDYSKM